MKVRAQLEGKPLIRQIAKLLMNSLYGRFGMHTDYFKYEIVSHERVIELSALYPLIDVITLGELEMVAYSLDEAVTNMSKDLNTVSMRKMLRGLPGQTNVAIAAAVTAYSRMKINGYKLLALREGLDIYYSDTDSLVLNGQLPPAVCDSAELGLLKLEHQFNEGIFVMPKVYYLDLGEDMYITKCKGLSGKLTKQHYLELLEGNSLELTSTKWIRSLREGTVLIKRDQPYHIQPLFNKRVKVWSKGKWIDTRPNLGLSVLHLNCQLD